MMISQSALLCLEASVRRLLGHVDRSAEPLTDLPPRSELPRHAVAMAPARLAAATQADWDAPTERSEREASSPTQVRHPQLAPLTPSERRARAAALRALALCRGRRFDAARAAFFEAARLDPALDLTRTPDFWKLERGAHEAAIAAYVDAGRDGDAAVLRARVRSTYRPKALRARPGAAVTP